MAVMNNFTKYAAILGLFLGWFCAGCRKSEPGVSVPSDVQKFLDTYFEAVKAKDIAKLQELSSYVPPADAEMPQQGVDMMRESKKKLTADAFQKMTQQFGDFKSYSVVRMAETTITTEELAAKNMQGLKLAGIHTEVICRARFSKAPKTVMSLNLFKETPESEFSIEAWRYEAQP